MNETNRPGVLRLDEHERARYEEDGYVVRERLFAADEVNDIIGCCERLVDEIVRDRRGRRRKAGSYVFEPNAHLAMIIKWEGDTDIVHGLEPFAHLSPEMKQWALDPRFVDPMKDICGDEAPALFTEKLNLKRPHVGGRNPLHQDYPYWLDLSDEPLRLATSMIFLDDSTLENGCLQVLPGSHRLGVAATRTDADDFGNNEIDPRPFAASRLVPAGGTSGLRRVLRSPARAHVRDEHLRSRAPSPLVQLRTEPPTAHERHPRRNDGPQALAARFLIGGHTSLRSSAASGLPSAVDLGLAHASVGAVDVGFGRALAAAASGGRSVSRHALAVDVGTPVVAVVTFIYGVATEPVPTPCGAGVVLSSAWPRTSRVNSTRDEMPSLV